MPSRPFDAIAELLLRALCRRRRITLEPYERRPPRTTSNRVWIERVIALTTSGHRAGEAVSDAH
jgi:hypothetical protein